jgi:hypothetical protein
MTTTLYHTCLQTINCIGKKVVLGWTPGVEAYIATGKQLIGSENSLEQVTNDHL